MPWRRRSPPGGVGDARKIGYRLAVEPDPQPPRRQRLPQPQRIVAVSVPVAQEDVVAIRDPSIFSLRRRPCRFRGVPRPLPRTLCADPSAEREMSTAPDPGAPRRACPARRAVPCPRSCMRQPWWSSVRGCSSYSAPSAWWRLELASWRPALPGSRSWPAESSRCWARSSCAEADTASALLPVPRDVGAGGHGMGDRGRVPDGLGGLLSRGRPGPPRRRGGLLDRQRPGDGRAVPPFREGDQPRDRRRAAARPERVSGRRPRNACAWLSGVPPLARPRRFARLS